MILLLEAFLKYSAITIMFRSKWILSQLVDSILSKYTPTPSLVKGRLLKINT